MSDSESLPDLRQRLKKHGDHANLSRSIIAPSAEVLEEELFGAVSDVQNARVFQAESDYLESDHDSLNDFIVKDANEKFKSASEPNAFSGDYDDDLVTEIRDIFGDLRPLTVAVPSQKLNTTSRQQALPEDETRKDGGSAVSFGIVNTRSDWDLKREALWIYSQLQNDFHDRENGQHSRKDLYIDSIVMFLRDIVIRHFDVNFVRKSVMIAKYGKLLTDSDLNRIVYSLDPEWYRLHKSEESLRNEIHSAKLLLSNHELYNNSEIIDCLHTLEIGKTISQIATKLEVLSTEPSIDYSHHLSSMSAYLSNYLLPSVRQFISAYQKIGISVVPSGLHSNLLFFRNIGLSHPSEFGRILTGQTHCPQLQLDSIQEAMQSSTMFQSTVRLISSDFHVKQWISTEMYKCLTVSTFPTRSLDASDANYAHARLLMRPVQSFKGSQDFLAIAGLVSRGEISMAFTLVDNNRIVLECATSQEVSKSIGPIVQNVRLMVEDLKAGNPTSISHQKVTRCLLSMAQKQLEDRFPTVSEAFVSKNVVSDPILTMIMQRLRVGSSSDTILNMLKIAVRNIYKEITDEIRDRLVKEASAIVSSTCASSFYAKMNMASFLPNIDFTYSSHWDLSAQKNALLAVMGFFVVASFVPDGESAVTLVVADGSGRLVEAKTFSFVGDALRYGGDSRFQAEIELLQSTFDRNHINLVTISFDIPRVKQILRLIEDIKLKTNDPISRQATTSIIDTKLSQGIAGIKSDPSLGFEGQPFPVNLALSICRFQQDPLGEVLNLWDENPSTNMLLSVPFHSLQHVVDRETLHRDYKIVISALIADTGVSLKDCISNPHRSKLLLFVPGLSADLTEKLIKGPDSGLRNVHTESEHGQESDIFSRLKALMGETRFIRAQPFLRVLPDYERLLLAIQSSRASLIEHESSGPIQFRGMKISVNELLASIGNSDIFNTLIVPKDSWPIIKGLLRLLGRQDIAEAIGNQDFYSEAIRCDLKSFISDMFDSPDVPDYLTDSEIDRQRISRDTESYIRAVLLSALRRPFADSRQPWQPADSKYQSQITAPLQSEFGLYMCRVSSDDGHWAHVKIVDAGNADGTIRKSGATSNKWKEGDRVIARFTSLDSSRGRVNLSIEPPSPDEVRHYLRKFPHAFFIRQDLDCFKSLGLVKSDQINTGISRAPKTRRVIRNSNYFEIDHQTALQKLAPANVGDVIFRPSSSSEGTIICMVKIKEIVSDKGEQDWVKTFQFLVETGRVGGSSKVTYRLRFEKDEFDELDQIKAVFIERYLRHFNEFRFHSRFRSETVEQIRNLVNAIYITDPKGHVAYHFAVDYRPEFTGNGLLLWCNQAGKVREDPIQIGHKGFKIWNKGPFATLNQLISWWKSEGFNKRSVFLREWQEQQYRQKKQ